MSSSQVAHSCMCTTHCASLTSQTTRARIWVLMCSATRRVSGYQCAREPFAAHSTARTWTCTIRSFRMSVPHLLSIWFTRPVIDKLTLTHKDPQLSCLEPGWCDYKTKTVHLDHVSAVSFTVSWDCPTSVPDGLSTLYLSVHTSTAGMTYDSVPVSLESQGRTASNNRI